ncbi:radical SAM protein [Maledivibacter halophilus]|uniref:Radical SAM superfamily enzyme, MoaA/NifB/PqqE/SkfB family n=1 Tax=Maledivibacter halophilus TaxID=36842 RepID=A0A1T5JSU4_9FIRM|nr:radical SAM protein [Maledivibacter halophilus]SKC54329.1 Radical SAM superfamily enzyme, MoaA/NifB/PqqE/SkfB family [Maledivibacter halophilus]
MLTAKKIIGASIVKEGISYIDKDPIKNIPKILNWADKLAVKEYHKKIIEGLRRGVENPENNTFKIIKRGFDELAPKVKEKTLINFFINSNIVASQISEKAKKKYNCNIPWAILMDPTSACNLKCKGCWAAEYDKADLMSNELLDRIISEGKELGIYMYLYSGGEPLVRRKDLIKIAQKHNDCMFLAFTNGTLIDEEFAMELQKVGNFLMAISIEGYEEETDMRRGKGTYQKVMKAMDILKKYGVGFGFSTCYHSKNTKTVGSDDYLDFMIEKGCMFGWYFTYIPIGKGAVLDLIANSEQREYMYRQVTKSRSEKPIFLMDFWNDGKYVNGCIAGGKNYLHINANGDVEPCAFIHYSNLNIKDVSLIEALKSPLFMEYQKNQPFNDNHLRPCPLLDNPNKLKEMVHMAKAHSTQPIDKESVDELTDKCQDVSKKWAITAEKLWKSSEK